jgi:hypothetical protein
MEDRCATCGAEFGTDVSVLAWSPSYPELRYVVHPGCASPGDTIEWPDGTIETGDTIEWPDGTIETGDTIEWPDGTIETIED